MRCSLGKLVQAGSIGLKQRCHLVDERTSATGTGTVHALLDAIVEVDDLGVLATELDGDVGLRNERLDGTLRGDNLLNKLEVKPLGKQHAARTRNGHTHACTAQHALGALEQLACRGADVRVVTLVVGIHQVVIGIDDGKLHRGGAHINAQTKVGMPEIDGICRAELGAILTQRHGIACGTLRTVGISCPNH